MAVNRPADIVRPLDREPAPSKPDAVPGGDGERRLVAEILRAVRQIRFGSVEIVIHDGRVVQIERREKLRFDGPDKRMER